MNIIKLKEFKETSKLYEMWNEELGFIFPITDKLFDKNVISYGGSIYDNSFVALKDDAPIGFVIAKTWDLDIEVSNYDTLGWVSLIYVKPSFRNMGIGSELLKKVEEIFINQNKKTICLGKDYYNFFPGLPTDLKYYCKWFENRGYIADYDTNDLLKVITKDTKLETLHPYKDGKNYTIRRATIADYDNLEHLIKTNWPGRWYYEFLDYFKKGGTGYEYMICLDENGIICGFCKICDYTSKLILSGYSMNFYGRFPHLGGIGPLGVDINYRRRNIANNILMTIINELIINNVTHIVIDWTNLMHIYRHYGFELWKSYTYMHKDIK